MKNLTFLILILVFESQDFLIRPVQKISIRRIKRGSVSVFHVTDAVNLPSILQDGLLSDKRYSSTGTDPALSEFDPYFEQYRPKHLPSRKEASFFFLTANEAERFIQARTRGSDSVSKVILEVQIDPERAYVVEADFKFKALRVLEVAARLKEFGPDTHNRFLKEHETDLEKSITSYWTSALKLSEFLNYYSFNGEVWIRKPEAPQNLPSQYILPEVIYPDRIPPANIKAD
jgi:hypothetical protein